MGRSQVAVLRTRPTTILEDYPRLCNLAGMGAALDPRADLLLKLNLSWTKYFPACSTAPWQLEGVLGALSEMGFAPERILPIENKTVVTNPRQGCRNNRWAPVLEKYGLRFRPLPEEEWIVHQFKTPLLRLNEIFPEGIEIPKLYPGRQILHLPTVKTHGHSTTTGAIKNSFGGLLREVRHYAHKYMHEVLVDLLLMQRELHPRIFAVMDGTVCGDGAGPRTMVPKIENVILAAVDQVAINAVAAKMMGFDPLTIPYLRLCHERGLGTADPQEIQIVGDDMKGVNFGFHVGRSLVIWGDQMLRRGPLRFLERIALHSPLVVWAPLASNVYHDLLWHPTIGRRLIRQFNGTEWGRFLQERYHEDRVVDVAPAAVAGRA